MGLTEAANKRNDQFGQVLPLVSLYHGVPVVFRAAAAGAGVCKWVACKWVACNWAGPCNWFVSRSLPRPTGWPAVHFGDFDQWRATARTDSFGRSFFFVVAFEFCGVSISIRYPTEDRRQVVSFVLAFSDIVVRVAGFFTFLIGLHINLCLSFLSPTNKPIGFLVEPFIRMDCIFLIRSKWDAWLGSWTRRGAEI